MKNGIKIFGIASVILGLLFFAFFFIISYDEFVNIALKIVGYPETKKEELTKIVTSQVFKIIRITPLSVSLVGGIIILFSGHINSIIIALKQWVQSVFTYLHKLPRVYLLSALCIIILSFLFNLYNIVNLPIFFDEVITYRYFAKRSIFASISYYPAPNNHILHSILTNITYNFPFSRTINLRLPSLIFSTFSAICFFYTFSKLLNAKIALFLLSVFCFLFPVAYYGYLSRGYTLVLLAFIICFYSTIKLISSSQEKLSFKKYLILLSIGAIIGFYTMPSFLYPYFAITSFLTFYLIKNKDVNNLFGLIVSAAATTLVVIVLYLPVFLVSGLEAVTNNKYVDPISRLEVFNQMVSHFSSTSDFLFSIPLFALLAILIIISAILIYKKVKIVSFSIYCFLSAPVILILHSVIPFPRTWVFLTIPFLFLVGLLVQSTNIDSRVNFKMLSALSLIFVSILVLNLRQKVADVERFSFLATEAADYLISQKASTVYGHRSLIATNLKYIFEEKNEDIVVINLYQQIPTDSIISVNKSGEYIITDKKMEYADGYKFVKVFGEDIFISKLE